jgi:hypothetical protein
MIKGFIILLSLCFAGCSHYSKCVSQASFTGYTHTRYPPRSVNDRIVLLSSLTPDRPFEEIGSIRVLKASGCTGNDVLADQYRDEQALIKKAREVGADAVIDIKEGAHGIETGIAIVFTDKK